MKILLCCNAGMSSSILVKKIRDVAEKTGEDIEVSAVANASIKNEVGKWDVCLVGPQLVFAVDSIHQQLNIPVASIEPRVPLHSSRYFKLFYDFHNVIFCCEIRKLCCRLDNREFMLIHNFIRC